MPDVDFGLRTTTIACRRASKTVATARALIETTTLPLRVIAERVGVPRSTLSKLRGRYGWRRPRAERLSQAGQRGGGHAIVPEVVAEARRLLEETRLSYVAIGTRLGVSPTTLCRWRKRERWQRPPAEVERRIPRPARYRRGRGLPYAADALGAARRLITTSLLSQKAIARQIGVSQAQVSVWKRKHGWERPDVRAAARRFGAARRVGILAEEGDRRGRPYADIVRREVCALFELTRLPTSLIGARHGVHPVTVARWAREGKWERPRGRAGARQPPRILRDACVGPAGPMIAAPGDHPLSGPGGRPRGPCSCPHRRP